MPGATQEGRDGEDRGDHEHLREERADGGVELVAPLRAELLGDEHLSSPGHRQTDRSKEIQQPAAHIDRDDADAADETADDDRVDRVVQAVQNTGEEKRQHEAQQHRHDAALGEVRAHMSAQLSGAHAVPPFILH